MFGVIIFFFYMFVFCPDSGSWLTEENIFSRSLALVMFPLMAWNSSVPSTEKQPHNMILLSPYFTVVKRGVLGNHTNDPSVSKHD